MSFTQENVVYIYVVYDINLWSNIPCADFALGSSRFEAVSLIKYAGSDKYKYSGYGIGFDVHERFSLSDASGSGKNVIMLCAEINWLMHIGKKKKGKLIRGKGPVDGLDDATLTAE